MYLFGCTRAQADDDEQRQEARNQCLNMNAPIKQSTKKRNRSKRSRGRTRKGKPGQHSQTQNDEQNCNHHQSQAQIQSYTDNQAQQTVQTQTFVEQINNTIENVLLTAKMTKSGKMPDETVNAMNDGLILALNMLAVSCERLHQENDMNSLQIGCKELVDQFETLKANDFSTYQFIEPHRKYMVAALSGQKGLRYQEERVRPNEVPLFQRDPQTINKAFAPIIQNSIRFDKRQDEMYDPNTNQKLAAEHQSKLEQYRNNDKYQNIEQQQYYPGKQSDLYFTESGKNAVFVNKHANEAKEEEKNAMDVDIYGPPDDVYDELERRPFNNAALKLSQSNPLVVSNKCSIMYPLPCQILPISQEERAMNTDQLVRIKPCFPFNDCTYNMPFDMLELNITAIKRYETEYEDKLKRRPRYRGRIQPGLGYKSIREQEMQIPTDVLMGSN